MKKLDKIFPESAKAEDGQKRKREGRNSFPETRRDLIVHWYYQTSGKTWANDSTVFLTSVMTEYHSLLVYFRNLIHNKQCLRFSTIRSMEYRTSAICSLRYIKKAPCCGRGLNSSFYVFMVIAVHPNKAITSKVSAAKLVNK